jgi:tetratricopeptide (TPR) repeat protein
MHAEREELVRRVFPRLRRLCEERGVAWREVDLRWGITAREAEAAAAVSVCLDEIDQCRPFFIGLLSERYGWVPDELPAALCERHGWLPMCDGKSVTELEVLHGVLRDPGAAHSLFYFRDPAYARSVPAAKLRDFVEGPSDDEVTRLGTDEAGRLAAGRSRALAELKDRVRASGVTVREGYRDPAALGEQVLADMTALIDREFPARAADPAEREESLQRAFAAWRAGDFVGRETELSRLDAEAARSGPPLAVLGEPGSGKSALLAHWARRRSGRPGETVLSHFVGASPLTSDTPGTLRRLVGLLARGRTGELPADPSALRAAFVELLRREEGGRVVVVLDGLDHLRDEFGDLSWLSAASGRPGVRLFVSAGPSPAADWMAAEKFPSLSLRPLDRAEREMFVRQSLGRYGKSLPPEDVRRVADHPASGQPLFLTTVVEELRVRGTHESLGRLLDHYLAAADLESLFVLVLRGLEADHEAARPALVGDALALLWATDRGLPELRLLELLGSGGSPLPQARWSPLALALGPLLANHRGLLALADEPFRRAVARAYVRGGTAAELHRRIAESFDPADCSPYAALERPRQLARAGDWAGLAAALAVPDFFLAAWNADPWAVKSHWASVEKHSAARAVAAYAPLLRSPVAHPDAAWALATLLDETGHPAEASRLREQLADIHRKGGDRLKLARALANRAISLLTQHDYAGSAAAGREAADMLRAAGDREGLQACLGNMAGALLEVGDADAAWGVLEEQEMICREINHLAGLGQCFSNKGVIEQRRGHNGHALELFCQAEAAYKQVNHREGLADALCLRARVAALTGDALALLAEAEAIYRGLSARDRLAICLTDKGRLRVRLGEAKEALACFGEAEQIWRELGSAPRRADAIWNQALVAQSDGQTKVALERYAAAQKIYEEVGDGEKVARAFVGQGEAYRQLGEADKARAAYDRAEALARASNRMDLIPEIFSGRLALREAAGTKPAGQAKTSYIARVVSGEVGTVEVVSKVSAADAQARARVEASLRVSDKRAAAGDLDGALAECHAAQVVADAEGILHELARSHGQEANLLLGAGRPKLARPPATRALDFARRADDRILALCLAVSAKVADALGRTDEELAALAERQQIYERLGLADETAAAKRDLADALSRAGRDEEARELLERLRKSAESSGDAKAEGEALMVQALAADRRNRFDDAADLLKRAERLFHSARNPEGVARAAGTCGMVLSRAGRHAEATDALASAAATARELELPSLLARCLYSHSDALVMLDRPDEAVELLKEHQRLCWSAPDLPALADSLILHAMALLRRPHRHDQALPVIGEAERVAKLCGNAPALRKALKLQVGMAEFAGDAAALLGALDRTASAALEAGDTKGQIQALCRLGVAHVNHKKDMSAATGVFARAEQIARGSGDPTDLAGVQSVQAQMLLLVGKPAEALAVARLAEPALRRSKETRELANCLVTQARALPGDLRAAVGLYREAEAIWRESGDKKALTECLTQQATAYEIIGGHQARVFELLDEAADLCRHTGDRATLAACLSGRAQLCLRDPSFVSDLLDRKPGIMEGLMSRFDEAAEIMVGLSMIDPAVRILIQQATLYSVLKLQPRAVALCDKAARLAQQHHLADLTREIAPQLASIRAGTR